jgi:AAA+ ATPase superfamily predicted ATPase
MPDFPTYYGSPLPKVLNPLNPLQYLVLLKWIFFQPSHLKHYLHQADPDLYRARGWSAMTQPLRLSAYRNLYWIALISSLLAAISLACAVSAAQATPIDWSRLLLAWAFGVAGGVAGGVARGVAGGEAGGVARGVAFGVAGGVAFGVAVGAAYGVAGGVAFGVAVGVAVGAGASRLIFYPFELFWVWLLPRITRDPVRRVQWHPALWDELAIWPLPSLAVMLRDACNADLKSALPIIPQVLRNPFQRWVIQRALSDWLAAQSDPLMVLYQLVADSMLDEYLELPDQSQHFRYFPSTRVVLLAEIAQVFASGRDINNDQSTTERLVWRMTGSLRRRRPTPVSQLAVLLHELERTEEKLKEKAVAEIQLAEHFSSNYEAACSLPHGAEVAGSFSAMAAFLNFTDTHEIAQASQHLAWLAEVGDQPVRPAIVEAFKALSDISLQVQSFEKATNPNQKAAALNLAAGALNELASYIANNVHTPEQVLLVRVAQVWQSIVADAQGQLGADALQHMSLRLRQESGLDMLRQSSVWQRPQSQLDNPYVVGNPVYPPLFVGRADILNRITEVWSAKPHPDSIIVYGHRRMGKSSILRNLDQVAPRDSVIVYVDLAGETSLVESTADLLLGLAIKLQAAVRRVHPQTVLAVPDSSRYASAGKAQLQFDQLTEQVRDVLGGSKLILALDEFEAIDRAVAAGKIGPDIYQFLRTKTQDPLFTFVLGGLHTLDEMSRDYQQPFYGSYDNIRVSYFSHDAAWRLITNPSDNFDLNYEPAAVERIIDETGGQPYLVQQICRDAIDQLNHELFDEHLDRQLDITLTDIETVLGRDFFRRGSVYFDGVWTQVSDLPAQTVLRQMSTRDEPWPFDELSAASQWIESAALRNILNWAEQHDILKKSDGDRPMWQFHVPLMRRWLQERSGR